MINIKSNSIFKKVLVLVMVLALMVSTILTQLVSAEETDVWLQKASMKEVRAYFSTAQVNGKIYAIGGGGNRNTTIEEYDPTIDKWTYKSSMKNFHQLLDTVVVDGKIYAVGGSDDIRYSLEEYNPISDTWATKAPMKHPRYDVELQVIDNKIYAIGGRQNSITSSVIEMFDPLTNTWADMTPMKQQRIYFKSEVVNGKIYVFGGIIGAPIDRQYTSIVEEYDPATNVWTEKASMTMEKAFMETKVINNKIYVMGGVGKTGSSDKTELYDPETDTWTTMTPMLTPRSEFESVVINNSIYVIGGDTTYSSTEVYDPATDTWTAKASASKVWAPAKCEVISNKIYIIGGGDNSDTTQVYTPSATNDPTLTVTPSAEKVKVGQAFTTTIAIHNVTNIFAEDIKITYDSELFEYVGAEAKGGMKICSEDAETLGTLRFITASLGTDNAATGDKDLIELKFKAKKAGTGKIDIIRGRIADNETLEIDVLEENCGEATIIVEAGVDVNRSGDATLLDLGIDAGYYNKNVADTDLTKYDADVDGNGMIDDADLSIITGDILLNDKYTPNNT